MLDGNYSVLRMLYCSGKPPMCSETFYNKVFRNHLRQCVQKSFTTKCSEITTTLCS